MSLKSSFIRMSITKQIYFGIFGMAILTCMNIFILIFGTAIIISNILYTSVTSELEKNDNKVMNLCGQSSDFTGNVLMNQGKSETLILRMFYDNLKEFAQKDYLLEFSSFTDTDNYFLTKEENNNEKINVCQKNQNCYYYQIFNFSTLDPINKTILLLMIPILNSTMKVKAYDTLAGYIFNEIYFILKEKNIYLSFPYNKNKLTNKYSIIYNDELFTLLTSTLVKKYKEEVFTTINILNSISTSDCTYDNFVRYNPSIVANFLGQNYLITPFFNESNPFSETGAFSFQKEDFKCNNTSSFNNLIDYIGARWDYNVINRISLSLTNRMSGIYALLVTNTPSMISMSWEVCSAINRLGIFYSDEYNGNNSYIKTKIETDFVQFIDCFYSNETKEYINNTFKYGINSYNSLKYQIPFASYNYIKDINRKIVVKLFQYFSPNTYIRSFDNSNFFFDFSFYYFLLKVQNGIIINENDIYFHFANLVFFILLCSLTVWIVIFLFLWCRISSVAYSISTPISKLISSISNSENNSEEGTPLNPTSLVINPQEKIISYKDDKDIGELFQLCQVLIVGGFGQKNNNKRNNLINIENNVTIVKTNNLMINEDNINSKKDEEYHLIFKDDVEALKTEKFEQEVYHKFESKLFMSEIEDFIIKKYDSIGQIEKNENIKYINQESQFLSIVGKNFDSDFSNNFLYRLYTEEIKKKKEKVKNNNFTQLKKKI